MKRSALFLIFLLRPLSAQLTLPDFFEEDEVFEEERLVPDPERQEGLHAREDATPREPSPEMDANTRQMLQQMNIGMTNMMRRPRNQEPGHVASEILTHLVGGPPLLEARLRDKEGKSRPATLLNQTLLVDTGVATLPIRLHLLASVEALPEKGHYRFLLKDEDEISGRPGLSVFLQQDKDSDQAVSLPMDSLERVDF